MTVNRMVNVMSGIMVMLSLALAQIGGQIDLLQMSWLWLAAFVGLNLFQMGFTGFCPAAKIFRALGVKESANSCATTSSGKGCC